ncbi:MAG TPA: hypothetical protein VGK83_04510 [Acidimicrobiia bacterium]
MTDTLTRQVEEQRPVDPGSGTPTKKLRVVVLGLVIAALLSLALFALTAGPSRAELEQARWEQVVDYYSAQYQVITDARAAAEAAHWVEVVNQYARQYELMRTAQSAPATDRQAAHWEAVVDYYEQQWEMRAS